MKFFSNFLLISSMLILNSNAMEKEESFEPSEWYEGHSPSIVYSISEKEFWMTQICPDQKFDIYLEEKTQLTKEEITEIKKLPSLNYTRLPLKESGEPDFDLSNWSLIGEADAIVAINPTERQIFATHNLHGCVAIAILSPQKTLFAHLTNNIFASRVLGKMLSDEQLPLLLQQLTVEECLQSRAILVSSRYSFIFADTYTSLRDAGITNISADVGPLLETEQGGMYLKASALKTELSTFESEDIEKLENALQQSYSVTIGRNLIINGKTGEVYSFSNSSQMHINDAHILDNWKKQKKISSKLAENCLTLRDYICLTHPHSYGQPIKAGERHEKAAAQGDTEA